MRRAGKNGFTLIEFIVVVLIMSIVLVYAVPKIESATKINIDRSARKLASAIAYARNESVFKKKRLRLRYDLDESGYSIKEINYNKQEGTYIQSDYEGSEPIALEDGVSFDEVETPLAGKVTLGEAYTHFSTSGKVEKTVIRLRNLKDDFRILQINILTGEVDISDKDEYDF